MKAIRIANDPCLWRDLGVEGLEDKSKSISHQQMLDELVGTRYIGTELGESGICQMALR